METAVAFEYCNPRTLLTDAAKVSSSYVRISDRAITWHLYFADGQLVYASNTAEPFERLERHLKALADIIPGITKEVRHGMRDRFGNSMEYHAQETATGLCGDYGALAWAVSELYVDSITAGTLASKVTAEVMEGYIQLPEANYQVERRSLTNMPVFCRLQLDSFLPRVEERLEVWRSLAPHLLSPYQRPYLASKSMALTRLKERRVKQLSKLLVGFNFRQLGTIVSQDELLFAQRLYPLIADRIILLRPPLNPFDKLPYPSGEAETSAALRSPPIESDNYQDPFESEEKPEQTAIQIGPLATAEPSEDTLGIDNAATATWRLACVDPGEVLVNAIKPLIADAEIAIEQVQDPTQALSAFTSNPPDLVFLQANMPIVDGYELCNLMRKSPMLKNTPIILVTSKKGLFDSAKIRMAGATDTLASPYSAKQLLGIIFRHLSN